MDFRDVPGWFFVFHEWVKVIPFRSNAATVRALKCFRVIPSISKARLTFSSLGGTTGIMELMKAFVMLEERPVIFIGVGILNSVNYFIGVAL